MIKHIVLFKLEESEHKNVRLQEIKDRLEALVQVIPELKEMQVGINVNPKEKWDLSLEVVVTDLQALEVYANHPAHQEIVKTLIAPVKVDRACVDYRF
ncbi:MAG: Dabb family protein [Odoribacter splanchnicus]